MPHRPNILWILADQWHHRCLGLRDHPDVRTPNLDRLAADGVNFDNAYSQSPLCQPSRVCCLTAAPCDVHRVFGNAPGRVDPRAPLMPAVYRDRGYHTAVAGKMHLDALPPEWGADFISSTLRGENWRVCGGGRAYSDDIVARGYTHPNDQTHGWVPNRVPPSSADPDDPIMVQCSGRSDIPVEDSIERWTADEGIRFLRDVRDPDRPFWLWLSFDRPHGPHSVPPPWDGRHTPESIHLGDFPDPDTLAGKPRKLLEDLRDIPEFTEERHLRRILSSYFNLIELIDHEIGRMLDALKEQDLYDDTVIAFCADHGDRAGVLRLNNKPGCTTDQINHVPLIVKPSGPCPAAGCSIDATVRLIDLWPTFDDLCGFDPPPGPRGASFAPALRGKSLPERTAVTDGLVERAVNRDGWALYTYWRRHRFDELYHLEEDPEERRDLGREPRFAFVRRRLKTALIEELSMPFGPADSDWLDRIVFGEEIPRGMWGASKTNRKESGTPGSVIEAAGMWMVEDGEHQLFLRLDDRPSRAYRLAERDKLEDIFDTPDFRDRRLEPLLDRLLDHLVDTARPVSASNHFASDAKLEHPSREEAEAFCNTRVEARAVETRS